MSLVVPRSFALYESEVPAQMFYLRESEAPAIKRPVGTEIPLVLQKDFYNKSIKDASHSRDTPF
ncbi:hypothetical protein CWD94_24505 [Lysinibacillus xylanilyticus]|uniref:Uncharacterized protein n=1 Tax=Lysinibacillus xylanilyticus TaxID=582475 RepID=A0A2M9PZ91_9BACI|nr:hypothetical protein CWD94_24505 [Lysinibacillus xylanilyticus]